MPASDSNSPGWFKSSRGDEPLELIAAAPLAYVLAAVIAHRARWKPGFNRYGITSGEAMIGDYWNYGMTEQQYRTSKLKLQQWGFATFRSTNRGTIGKLTNTVLFSVLPTANNEQNHRQSTGEPRTSNEPATNQQRLTKNRRTEELKKGDIESPQFEPVKPGLWRREYEAMIRDAEGAIKAIKAKPENRVKDLTSAAEDLIAWLEKEKPENWQSRVNDVFTRPDSYERRNLKPKPAAMVQAWKGRIEEIRRAMAGIKDQC